jgi:hypothetical protein
VNRSQLTDRNRHLPDVPLVSASGAPESLLRHGRALLVIVLHDVNCRNCLRYIESLGAINDELNSWDMDVAVVAPDAMSPKKAFRCFVDAESRFAKALGGKLPTVIVVDQWGDVKELHEAGDPHTFPSAAALVAWARYLATQCPECEGESL